MTCKNMKLIFSKTNNKAGFTLLEALIAITVLIFALVATMTAARSGLASAYESRDQVIAFYLAQEAIEHIRNIRDQNGLLTFDGTPTPWRKGISETTSDPCSPGFVCMVDVVAGTISRCGSTCTTPLRQDPSSKMYGYNSAWPTTQFRRDVTVQHIGTTNTEIAVTVLVTWRRGTFEVREIIFNWQT